MAVDSHLVCEANELQTFHQLSILLLATPPNMLSQVDIRCLQVPIGHGIGQGNLCVLVGGQTSKHEVEDVEVGLPLTLGHQARFL